MQMSQLGYDEVAFSRDVIARWGHMCNALMEDDGLLHAQMGHLGGLCEDQPEVAPEVFELLEGLLVRKDTISEIENAVAISFLDWERVQRLGFFYTPAHQHRGHDQRAVGAQPTMNVAPDEGE